MTRWKTKHDEPHTHNSPVGTCCDGWTAKLRKQPTWGTQRQALGIAQSLRAPDLDGKCDDT